MDIAVNSKEPRHFLMAMAAGGVRKVEAKYGRQAHDYRLKKAPLGATFHYFARRALKEAPDCLEE